MPKIAAEDAWIAFTPPTKANQENYTCGQLVVDTADRMPLYLNADPSRRLQVSRKLIPDDAAVPELEVYRAMMRLITLDGFAFSTVWAYFHSIEGLAEAIPDGAYRDPQRVDMGA